MYDAIVVGARCAGAATAMLIARQGHRVLLVDRSSFPSDIPNGHYIHNSGPRHLAEWGLIDRVIATGCPPVTSQSIDFGDFPLAADQLEVDGIPSGIGPRRKYLDQVVLDAAIEAGVEFRPRYQVNDFVAVDGRVVGIEGRSALQGSTSERAKIVIGADGRNSRLAKFVRANEYDTEPPLTCWYFSYWSGIEGSANEVYVRDDRLPN